jgi:SPP1 family predicted phage head-tail adaptor
MKRMSERIQFVRAETTGDDSGGYIAGKYKKLYECWANVQQSASNRDFQNMQMANMVSVEITMRYAFTFIPNIDMNIIYREKLLTIHGAPDLSEKNFIKITAFYDPAENIET